jgi:RNA polymerase sigma factor for flagellar operon FliA
MRMNAYAEVSARSAGEAREQMIAEHLDMARRIAQRVGRRVPSFIAPDDLVGAAMTGLIEAVDRFDPTRGEPFVAFAERRIRGAVIDELRRGDILPRRVRATARKVSKTQRLLEHKLGRPAEDTEMAEALGVPLAEYHEELELLTHIDVVELVVGERGESRGTHDEREGPLAVTERRQAVARLQEGIAHLGGREQTILSLYYVEELSYSEIGEVLGVSESRICQLHGAALAQLRTMLEEEEEGE